MDRLSTLVLGTLELSFRCPREWSGGGGGINRSPKEFAKIPHVRAFFPLPSPAISARAWPLSVYRWKRLLQRIQPASYWPMILLNCCRDARGAKERPRGAGAGCQSIGATEFRVIGCSLPLPLSLAGTFKLQAPGFWKEKGKSRGQLLSIRGSAWGNLPFFYTVARVSQAI